MVLIPTGWRRTTFVAAIAALLVIGMATGALAVMTFADGKQFLGKNKEYQYGYVAGAVDMLAALQDAGFIGPANSKDAKRIVDCATDSKLEELRALAVQHLERTPGQSGNNAASTIYVALRAKCT